MTTIDTDLLNRFIEKLIAQTKDYTISWGNPSHYDCGFMFDEYCYSLIEKNMILLSDSHYTATNKGTIYLLCTCNKENIPSYNDNSYNHGVYHNENKDIDIKDMRFHLCIQTDFTLLPVEIIPDIHSPEYESNLYSLHQIIIRSISPKDFIWNYLKTYEE